MCECLRGSRPSERKRKRKKEKETETEEKGREETKGRDGKRGERMCEIGNQSIHDRNLSRS